MTIIDCGPSYFTIWRLLHWQDIASIIRQLESIFYDRGPLAEILTDNSVVFSSEKFSQFLRKWGVWLQFWCVNMLVGNGIVERCHRSIKLIAARKRCLIPKAVSWYNVRPKDGVLPTTAPANMVDAYHSRLRGIDITMAPSNMQGKYITGDRVWVKTLQASVQTNLEWGMLPRLSAHSQCRSMACLAMLKTCGQL